MLVNASLDGIIAFAMWRAQPPLLRGMGWIAAGYLLLPLSFLTYLMDGFPGTSPHLVTVRNVLTNGGLVCIAEGIVIFLGHRRRMAVVCGFMLFTAASFEFVQWAVPAFPHYRVVLSQLIIVSILIRPIWGVSQSSGQKMARGLLSLTLYAGCVIGIARAAFTAFHPEGPSLAFSPQVLGWQFFQTVVVENIIFFALLVMVGARLAEDLQTHSEYLKRERQTNETLADALDRERQHRSEQSQFLGMLAHELGSPLALIGRSAEMVLAGLGQAQADMVQRLETIQGAVKRTTKLIADLIAAERTNQDNSGHDLLDLSEIVDAAINNLDDLADAERIVFTPGSQPLPFRGDRVMMVTAVFNVIDNALKYSPATASVEIFTECGETYGLVRVRDHGIGFPVSEIAKIGSRFFRASNAKKFTGTGLGMHIVSLILEKYGGDLAVENNPDGGAAVTLRVPLHSDQTQ